MFNWSRAFCSAGPRGNYVAAFPSSKQLATRKSFCRACRSAVFSAMKLSVQKEMTCWALIGLDQALGSRSIYRFLLGLFQGAMMLPKQYCNMSCFSAYLSTIL
jgi:hypothetical protein